MTREPLKFCLLFPNTFSQGALTDGFLQAAVQHLLDGSARTHRDKFPQPKETSEETDESAGEERWRSNERRKKSREAERGQKKPRQDVIAQLWPSSYVLLPVAENPGQHAVSYITSESNVKSCVAVKNWATNQTSSPALEELGPPPSTATLSCALHGDIRRRRHLKQLVFYMWEPASEPQVTYWRLL